MIVTQLNQEAEKMEGTGRGKLFKSAANEILELRQRVDELEAEMEIHKRHTELVGSLTHYMVKRGIGTPGQCSTTEIVRVYEELEAQQSEVAAHVELLVSKGRNVCEGPYNHYLYEMEEALNQTPATSLNAVRREVARKAYIDGSDCGDVDEYINQRYPDKE